MVSICPATSCMDCSIFLFRLFTSSPHCKNNTPSMIRYNTGRLIRFPATYPIKTYRIIGFMTAMEIIVVRSLLRPVKTYRLSHFCETLFPPASLTSHSPFTLYDVWRRKNVSPVSSRRKLLRPLSSGNIPHPD